MKKAFLNKVLLVPCAALVLASMAGCAGKTDSTPKSSAPASSSGSAAGTSSDKTQEPVTLKVFFSGAISGAAIQGGIQDDGVAKEIEKRLGIKLDLIGNTKDDQLTSYLASGELPDLTMVGDSKLFPQIIKGKLALKLDDLIQSKGKDLLANAPQKVEYSKKNFSDGTDALYAIPGPSGPGMTADKYMFGLNVRWDLYKKLGYPQLNTYTDVLPLLKKMQDLEPVNEQGQKVYGISLNTDWDGPTALYSLLLGPMYGWDTTEQKWHAEIDDAHDYAVKSSFDPDSWMFKGADFLYKANQMGLLDPDSISQKFSARDEKMKAGRILFSAVQWDTGAYDAAAVKNGHPEKGFMPIYPKDSTNMWQFGPEPNGIGGAWFISSKTKYPEKAMEFLNFINSYDGAMLLYNGVKGKDWVEKDGKPYLTDDAIAAQKDPKNNTGIGKYYNAVGLNEWTVIPQYGEMLGNRQWQTTKARTYSDIFKDYDAYFGVDAPFKAYDKQRTQKVISDIYRPYMGVMPDDIAQINQKVSDMAKTEIYKMIFAKNDAEEQKIKDDIIKKAKDLGVDKEVDWIKKEREAAKAKYEAAHQK